MPQLIHHLPHTQAHLAIVFAYLSYASNKLGANASSRPPAKPLLAQATGHH